MRHVHHSQAPVAGLTGPAAPRTLRASNDDRQRVLDLLQAHYVAGRLTSSELEERIERAVAARTLGDLDAELTDLPSVPTSPPEGPAHQRRRHSKERWMPETSDLNEKGLRAHATSYLLVMAMLVAIWALTTPGGYFWPVWPMLGWGIGLASHAFGRTVKSPPSIARS
jgi:hypothetical protein